MSTNGAVRTAAVVGGGFVLVTLATGQFVMTLDSSVMSVSIATVAKDVGTTVTGIQTVLAVIAVVALFFTGRIPKRAVGVEPTPALAGGP